MMQKQNGMKNLGKIIYGVAAITYGCHSPSEKSQLLVEANKIHMEAIAIQEQTEKDITIEKEIALQQQNISRARQLDSLGNLVELWKEGIVEVPGFAHEHHHDDGEHHEHKTEVQMTDESMLDYQVSSKKAIATLRSDVQQLSKAAP